MRQIEACRSAASSKNNWPSGRETANRCNQSDTVQPGPLTANGKVSLVALVHRCDLRETNELAKVAHLRQGQPKADLVATNSTGGYSLLKKLLLPHRKGQQKRKPRRAKPDKAGQQYDRSAEQETASIGLENQSALQQQQHHHQDQQQVIEFKFDLIVDADHEQEQVKKQQQQHQSRANDDLLRNTNGELDSGLGELALSFAAEANDVCLVSLKNEHPKLDELQDQVGSSPNSQYVMQIAAKMLDQTLEVLKRDESGESSVAVSATLMSLNDQSARADNDDASQAPPTQLEDAQLSIVDLLQKRDDDENGQLGHAGLPMAADAGFDGQSSALVCANRCDSQQCISTISTNLASQLCQSQSNSRVGCLLVALKLTRRINGGAFSNRMCLIGLDPEWRALHPILESAFNGRALAHLKQQRHLAAQRGADRLSEQEARLMQAEWILYKQLSSALIRTLVLVHVHKLVADATGAPVSLMESNLAVLKLANSIQVNSSYRSRRRQELLLKNRHLTSSNTSICSDRKLRRHNYKSSQRSALDQHQHQYHHGHQSSSSSSGNKRARHLDNVKRRFAAYREQRLVRSGRCRDQQQRCLLTESTSSTVSNSTSESPRYATARLRPDYLASEATTNQLTLSDDCESLTSATNTNTTLSYELGGSNNKLRRPVNGWKPREPDLAGAAPASVKTSASSKQNGSHVELRSLSGTSRKSLAKREGQSGPFGTSPTAGSVVSSRLILDPARQPTAANAKANVFQIDCKPTERPKLAMFLLGSDGSEYTANGSQMSDNASEPNEPGRSPTPSAEMAEPLRQLKLEQFLNQFSGIIAPLHRYNNNNNHPEQHEQQQQHGFQGGLAFRSCDTGGSSSFDSPSMNQQQLQRFGQPAGFPLIGADLTSSIQKQTIQTANHTGDDDDDEECKSHSSVLEHLSSLALESTARVNCVSLADNIQPNSVNNSNNNANHSDSSQQASTGFPSPPPPMSAEIETGGSENELGTISGLLSQLLNGPQVAEPELIDGKRARVLLKSSNHSKAPSNSLEDQLRSMTVPLGS